MKMKWLSNCSLSLVRFRYLDVSLRSDLRSVLICLSIKKSMKKEKKKMIYLCFFFFHSEQTSSTISTREGGSDIFKKEIKKKKKFQVKYCIKISMIFQQCYRLCSLATEFFFSSPKINHFCYLRRWRMAGGEEQYKYKHTVWMQADK